MCRKLWAACAMLWIAANATPSQAAVARLAANNQAPATDVSLPAPAPAAGLSADAIKAVARTHLTGIRACYNALVARAPGRKGVVRVEFTVTPAGTVTAADVLSSDVDDSATEQCILAEVSSWQFPEPADGGAATVVMPFTLGKAGASQRS